MKLYVRLALGAGLVCAPAVLHAQATAVQPLEQAAPSAQVAAAPSVAVAPAASRTIMVPAGLSVPMSINSGLSTSRNQLGEAIALTVTQDVLAEGTVVIPRGTRAVGEITMRSGRGMFGKSGKMEIAFRYLDMDGMRVPLEGSHFQAGNGNTAGTVGAVVAAGVIGGMVVTGRSANITENQEFTARTLDALPIVVTEQTAGSYDRPLARLAATYTPTAVQTGSPRQMEKQRLEQQAREARQQRRRSR